ncbi:hypothetical protein ACLKA6_009750 [Drosophila palustris]
MLNKTLQEKIIELENTVHELQVKSFHPSLSSSRIQATAPVCRASMSLATMPAQVTVNSAISQSSEIQRQPTLTTNAHHMGSIMSRPGSIELYAPNENVATHQLHGQMELKHVATSQQHVPNTQMYAPNENVATHQLHGQIESASVAASQQHAADAQMYMLQGQ